MVRWKDLKLNEQMSKQDRFNFIMAYIDEHSSSSTEETKEDKVVEEEVIQKGTVSVTVIDGENGIGNVSVVLSQDGSEDTYTCPNGTGGAGGCTISNVPYGEYDVTATCDGYVTEETTVTVNDASVNLEITLTLETVEQTEEPTG